MQINHNQNVKLWHQGTYLETVQPIYKPATASIVENGLAYKTLFSSLSAS